MVGAVLSHYRLIRSSSQPIIGGRTVVAAVQIAWVHQLLLDCQLLHHLAIRRATTPRQSCVGDAHRRYAYGLQHRGGGGELLVELRLGALEGALVWPEYLAEESPDRVCPLVGERFRDEAVALRAEVSFEVGEFSSLVGGRETWREAG
eukprot:CAMPEP_0205899768 /NCGR_PEP_ID=MMETSP1083-20121108/26795_1 /ASSEMBLY_ACC=CAM_ASM_000430 /TAXON_ID=97485 /ORGANISM="Prymnesium parvum, Strain Texoma1" /LENGTH=147 /DNA_ID=CAMNT_0053265193 /DNA_START=377 /DNA_END=817 /DNA_ORIENTATION=+